MGNQVFEQYRYDALGRRVLVRSRTTDGTGFGYAERTVWDGSQILYEIRAIGGDSAVYGEMESDNPSGSGQYAGKLGVVGYSHAGGIDRPVTLFRGGTAVVPYVDWHGSPASGSYMDGTATTAPCPPFPAGRTTVDGEKSGEPCTEWWGSLVSAQTDGSGLEYMRNRYYDPRTGRFTQEDPIGLAGGMNLYGFAAGDPLNFGDPFGLCKKYKDGSEDATCRKLVNDLNATADEADKTLAKGETNHFREAANAYEATDREVQFVSRFDKDLNWRGYNNDSNPNTFDLGATTGDRILIGNFLPKGDVMAVATHEILVHGKEAGFISVSDFAPVTQQLNREILSQLPSALRPSAVYWRRLVEQQ